MALAERFSPIGSAPVASLPNAVSKTNSSSLLIKLNLLAHAINSPAQTHLPLGSN